MYSKSSKMILISFAIIIMVGTSFIIIRIQNETYSRPRPETHLEPYLSDTTNLNLTIVGEGIEISINDFKISTMNPHFGNTTIDCKIVLDISNTGNETINDFKAIMGTTFDSNNEVLYSFWIDMRHDQNIMIEKISIPPLSTISVTCFDFESLQISDDYIVPEQAYARMLVEFNANYSAIITTSLSNFWQYIE